MNCSTKAKRIRVLHLISPIGFYGAERWIVAAVKNADLRHVEPMVAVTSENSSLPIEILTHLPPHVGTFRLEMSGRFDVGVISQLKALLRERQIQVLHTHGYKSDLIGLLAARQCGVPAISTPHGFNADIGLKLRLFIWLGSRSLRYFDRVVPLSPQLCEEVERMGVPKGKVTYIPNGLDLTELDDPDFAIRACRPTIRHFGTVGQLIPRKRVDHILSAFNELWKRHPDVRLSILGDGPERPQLERRASALEARQSIQFLGFRPDRLDLLNTFDAFLMASSYEGIPRAMMEAMALGVPVVAYRIPGVDQLIENGRTGLLADSGNVEQLLERCLELVREPSVASAMGAAARKVINERFSGARMARDYQSLYEELVTESCAV